MLSDVRSGGLVSILEVQFLFFFIKENWIFVMTKHHDESKSNMLLTRNLPIDSDVRKRIHSLMISLHYLKAKSNDRMRVQFERGMTWFCFCFYFVRSHARCGCCSIVCWRGWSRRSFKIGRPMSRGVGKF